MRSLIHMQNTCEEHSKEVSIHLRHLRNYVFTFKIKQKSEVTIIFGNQDFGLHDILKSWVFLKYMHILLHIHK